MSWKFESSRHILASKGIKTSMGRKDQSPNLENLEMNDKTYELRREVMNIIYDAKELCELPYITVRITKKDDVILGQASITDDNVLWITKNTLNKSENKLRNTVYHEILHTIFGVPHQDGCPLMGEYAGESISKERADELFKKYAKEYGGECE